MARNQTSVRRARSERIALSRRRKERIMREQKKQKRNARIMKGEPTPKNDKTLLIKTKKFQKDEKKKRLSNMNRDADRYALLEFVDNPDKVQFTLSSVVNTRKTKISFKKNNEVNCSCFDWKIRCKKYNISCKHILYVLDRILKININTVQKNKLKHKNVFKTALEKLNLEHLNNKCSKFQVRTKKEITKDDLCLICFSDYIYDCPNEFKDKVLECPTCHNYVHKDCMICWLKNSYNHNCIYCRDPVWGSLIKE